MKYIQHGENSVDPVMPGYCYVGRAGIMRSFSGESSSSSSLIISVLMQQTRQSRVRLVKCLVGAKRKCGVCLKVENNVRGGAGGGGWKEESARAYLDPFSEGHVDAECALFVD